jgi:hypothetical protein
VTAGTAGTAAAGEPAAAAAAGGGGGGAFSSAKRRERRARATQQERAERLRAVADAAAGVGVVVKLLPAVAWQQWYHDMLE